MTSSIDVEFTSGDGAVSPAGGRDDDADDVIFVEEPRPVETGSSDHVDHRPAVDVFSSAPDAAPTSKSWLQFQVPSTSTAHQPSINARTPGRHASTAAAVSSRPAEVKSSDDLEFDGSSTPRNYVALAVNVALMCESEYQAG